MDKVNFIKFLGTAGARFVVLKQLRYSGGIWLNYDSVNILIDPGPGSLLRCQASRPKLDPFSLDGLILTHKHLDHSNDINVMIEAMTAGGLKKRGQLWAPADAWGAEGVIFSYLKDKVKKTKILREGTFQLDKLKFSVPVKNQHAVETYGLKFYLGRQVVSYISDTRYFDSLAEAYSDSDILILNVVFYQSQEQYQHLSLPDALALAKKISPQLVILTHFGMSILKKRPHELEKEIAQKSGLNIKFAQDGMSLALK